MISSYTSKKSGGTLQICGWALDRSLLVIVSLFELEHLARLDGQISSRQHLTQNA